jgi:phytoene dehydrogenase-like protein
MRNGTQPHTDAVVIGGGLAGLAAATYLARGGRSVTVLERSGAPGGRAMTNELNGFRFNLGPHALYRKGPAARVLRELGVAYNGGAPSNSGYAIRDGRLHTVSQSPLWFLSTRLLSGRAKVEAARRFVAIQRTDPASVRHLNVRQWIEQHARQPEVRELIGALVRVSTYASDFDRLGAEVAVTQLRLAARGVLYLHQGWQTLVDGLRAAAERASVRIQTGAAVEAIEHEGAVRAVRLKDGRRIETNTAIIAAGPEVASRLIDTEETRRWAADAVPVRAACLDIGLRRLPSPRRTFALGLDEPVYFSDHSRVARVAPEGAHTVHIAKYLTPEDTDAAAHERQLEALADLVQPGWRDELAARRYLPNMTVVSTTPSPESGALAGRPGPGVPGIAGLYVAGDWVGSEGWLADAALASARRAAGVALAQTADGDRSRGGAFAEKLTA